jgi:hypothetical protein
MRRGIAKVAMARKPAVHLYWMCVRGLDYGQLHKLGSHCERAHTSPWCAVNRRRKDWASRSPLSRSSK